MDARNLATVSAFVAFMLLLLRCWKDAKVTIDIETDLVF